jgi:endonuclease YncB( thermonuclease family)
MILLLVAGASMVVPAGQTFRCTPTAVYDGDGPIWCREGPKIRLAGIAAREMDETCNANQPCPNATARQARDQLVRLLGGARGTLSTGHITVVAGPMTCLSEGGARGSRTAAWCRLANGADLNCAMIRSGTTLRWARYWGRHQC